MNYIILNWKTKTILTKFIMFISYFMTNINVNKLMWNNLTLIAQKHVLSTLKFKDCTQPKKSIEPIENV